MTTTACDLPDDLATAHELIRELAKTVHTQGHLIAKLQHQLEQLLRQRYGRKTETIDPAQLLLFAREILAAGETTTPEPSPPSETPPTPAEANPPKKNGHGRKRIPAHLPRKPELHDVSADKLPCPDCGILRTRIGQEIREQLETMRIGEKILRMDLEPPDGRASGHHLRNVREPKTDTCSFG